MDYERFEVDFFLKNYDVGEPLGEGGFGATYLCHNHLDKRSYVVKVIPCSNEDTEKNIVECVALANLKHENIAQYYCAWIEAGMPDFAESFVQDLKDSVETDDPENQYIRTLYIAMEHYPRVLKDEIKKEKVFTDYEAKKIFEGLAKALAFIHENGWVHCDFHPGNIFLDESGNAIVGDFGLSKRDDGAVLLSQGNRMYQAKEVLEGKPYTTGADIFSFALCIIEIVCEIKSGMQKAEIFGNARMGIYPEMLFNKHDWLSNSIKMIVTAQLPSARLTASQLVDMVDFEE